MKVSISSSTGTPKEDIIFVIEESSTVVTRRDKMRFVDVENKLKNALEQLSHLESEIKELEGFKKDMTKLLKNKK